MVFRRRNLIVDDDRLKTLSARLRMSKSRAVRRAVDLALAGEEVAEALRRLRLRGTLEDAYRRSRR
jgi:hypothetical protein